MVKRALGMSLGVAVALNGLAVHAAECEGIKVSDTLEVGGEKLVLNGLGLREATMFKIDVYVAALYVRAKSSNGDEIANADESKLMRLTFVRDVSKADMRKAITEGLKASSPQEWPSLEERTAKFFELLPAFDQGQTLTLWYAPGKGLQVKAPGKGSGTIEGSDFSRALFRVWLGDHPVSNSLKKGLLGGSCA